MAGDYSIVLETILMAAGCSAAMQKNNHRRCWSATQTSHGHGWLLVSNADSTDYRWVLVRHADKPWTRMVAGQQCRQHLL